MGISREQIIEAYKKTSHPNGNVVLTDAERRVLKLLGLMELDSATKRRIIKEKLNQAWSKTQPGH